MQKKFLLIQLRQLGDILLTTPAIQAIKQTHPNAHITFLSSKMGRLILEGNPYLDEYFFYDETNQVHNEWRLAKTLRSKNYDVVIDFMNNPRSAFYTWMSGGGSRIAFSSSRQFAYTRCLDRRLRGQGYIVHEKFKLLEAANVNAKATQLLLPWFESHTRPLMKRIGEEPTFAQAPMRVVIAPTHRRSVRQWPLENYVNVAQWLIRTYNAHITWLWGPDEQHVAQNCHDLMNNDRSSLAPKTTFREMAAFIANCDFFLGNSNGPSHVAVAVDTPSLQIHGHTIGTSWCPDTNKHQFLQAPNPKEISSLQCSDVIEKLTNMKASLDQHQLIRPRDQLRFSWRS